MVGKTLFIIGVAAAAFWLAAAIAAGFHLGRIYAAKWWGPVEVKVNIGDVHLHSDASPPPAPSKPR